MNLDRCDGLHSIDTFDYGGLCNAGREDTLIATVNAASHTRQRSSDFRDFHETRRIVKRSDWLFQTTDSWRIACLRRDNYRGMCYIRCL